MMGHLDYLSKNGISVRRTEEGNIRIKGLSKMNDPKYSQIIQYVKENKEDILSCFENNKLFLGYANKANKANKGQTLVEKIQERLPSKQPATATKTEAKSALRELVGIQQTAGIGLEYDNAGAPSLTFDPPLDQRTDQMMKEAEYAAALFREAKPLLENEVELNPKRIKPSQEMVKAWKTSRPWLLENLLQLEELGWTRRQLFQSGRYTYPHGPWGVAWSRNWLREDATVSIEPDGGIRWSWVDTLGKTISQTARPEFRNTGS